jgi:GntR family transcriptional regulator, transcriptional repressor for pyruvate dehydrogenase complex
LAGPPRRVPSTALQRVHTPRVYTAVVNQILALIDAGEVAAGDVLPPERELAQQLGVSRSSVREAMAALEVLGIVHTRPGSGIFIQHSFEPPVLDQISAMTAVQGPLEVLETRLLFEPGVAALAAERRSDADLERLRAAVDGMDRELQAGGNAWQPDWGFHRMIARAAGNPIVEAVHESLGERMEHPLWQLMRTHNLAFGDRPLDYLHHHRDILAAIKDQDAAEAARAMRFHIETIQRDLENIDLHAPKPALADTPVTGSSE